MGGFPLSRLPAAPTFSRARIAMQHHGRLSGVAKHFGGVEALRDVTLSIARGSIHALVGENGAGKSTLGKILAGVHPPDRGEVVLDGRRVHMRSPREALGHGVTMIAQEISLIPDRTVLDNVYLGIHDHTLGVVARRRVCDRYRRLCENVGFDIPAEAMVRSLGIADQKKVEILRAVAREAHLIVMDEPTAALPADDAATLFDAVHSLRARGTTIVYVSHFLEEVLALADTVTVLRDGQLVQTSPADQETPSSLVQGMLGRSMDMAFPPKTAPRSDAPVVLSVANLQTPGPVKGVSFDVREGEIVGLAGLVGSGRSEVARAIFGADRRTGGTITLAGRQIDVRNPAQALRAGIALLPESRKTQGLFLGRSVVENVTLPHLATVAGAGVVRRRHEAAAVKRLIDRVDVRGAHNNPPVGALSGGNQQKVLFAKWLFRQPRILVVDEPTRGVDVGAKHAIHVMLQSLAAEGMAVLMISSELEEVLGLAHRVLVMRAGEIVASFEDQEIAEHAVMAAAFGTSAAPTHGNPTG